MTRKISLLLFAIFGMVVSLFAQAEDADFMRSMGKMYVVIGVLVIIFLVLIIYLIFIDRKVKKLEQQIAQDEED